MCYYNCLIVYYIHYTAFVLQSSSSFSLSRTIFNGSTLSSSGPKRKRKKITFFFALRKKRVIFSHFFFYSKKNRKKICQAHHVTARLAWSRILGGRFAKSNAQSDTIILEKIVLVVVIRNTIKILIIFCTYTHNTGVYNRYAFKTVHLAVEKK